MQISKGIFIGEGFCEDPAEVGLFSPFPFAVSGVKMASPISLPDQALSR
jgi:hypothetical protein